MAPCARESMTLDADCNLMAFMVQWGRQTEPRVILVRSAVRTVCFRSQGVGWGEGKLMLTKRVRGFMEKVSLGPGFGDAVRVCQGEAVKGTQAKG